MNKNRKKTVFKSRQTNIAKPRIKMDFIDIIVKAIKNFPSLELNIPETIAKNGNSKESCLLFTNDEGHLYCKENISKD